MKLQFMVSRLADKANELGLLRFVTKRRRSVVKGKRADKLEPLFCRLELLARLQEQLRELHLFTQRNTNKTQN